MFEDGHDGLALRHVGDDAPAAAASARKNILEVHPPDQRRPIDSRTDRLEDAARETAARAAPRDRIVAVAIGAHVALLGEHERTVSV